MVFSNRKYAEMHFVYGSCDRTLGQLREYRKIRIGIFLVLKCSRLIESGCVQKQQNEVGSALDFYVDYQILLRVEEGPENSSRRLALEIGVS